MKINASWITNAKEYPYESAIVFFKEISISEKVDSASLTVTSAGTYQARINGDIVGKFVFAPGWTQYDIRLQYQTYDVTDMLKKKNKLEIEVGLGWARGRLGMKSPCGVIAELKIKYASGKTESIPTDSSWKTVKSNIYYSDIYNGEKCDARYKDRKPEFCKLYKYPHGNKTLIPQEGEIVCEHEHIAPTLITAPNGDRLLDFGQNMTGYVRISFDAHAGERIVLECAEILDKDGNFYNENYRSAKSKIEYTCKEGYNDYRPRFSFFGFRYMRLAECPEYLANADNFEGICVYSDIKRTGYLKCSNMKLNKLFDNIIWGQKDNYLDIPTDCPQRDERLGWTGDAQVFVRAASLNFDVEKFFTKWLHDMKELSDEYGRIPRIIPYGVNPDAKKTNYEANGSAWGDAATVCPWEIYLTYGNKKLLKEMFPTMCGWVDYMTYATKDKYMFTGHFQFGDWLGLDAPEGSYTGATRKDFMGTAFYAYSAGIVIKAGKALGEDVSKYEELFKHIVNKFQEVYEDKYETQSEHALALRFGIAKDKKKTAKSLADMIKKNGNKLTTGFVGTAYLLHALSENGYADVAYDLLLQEEYPSWLFSVNMGATTIWEHWDSKKADGSFWSTDMNSFNHYAYGAVADWVYGVAAGINRVDNAPGFEKIVIAPVPDKRLGFLEASIMTKKGLVKSKWTYEGDVIRYEITTPSDTEVIIGGKSFFVNKGEYLFFD